jgi:hypothetical protein
LGGEDDLTPGEAGGGQFGYCVAVSGDRAIVGTPYADGGSTDRGAAYLFGANRTPTSAELLAASDTGVSSTDNVTSLDNSTDGDRLQFFDTTGNDTFTASPTDARLTGPAGSNILYIATTDLGIPTYKWDTVRAYSQVGGYDKAYLTGSTGADTFLGYAKPRATNAGLSRLSGTGYFLEVYQFDEVYANLLTGSDAANLYDGSVNDYFWAKLGAAVLTDGTLNDTTGDLVTPGTYYYKVYGFDSAASDHVNLYGTSGGTNTKRVITPLDYLLATYGSWTDAP